MLQGMCLIMMCILCQPGGLHKRAAHGRLAAGPTARADVLLRHNRDARSGKPKWRAAVEEAADMVDPC